MLLEIDSARHSCDLKGQVNAKLLRCTLVKFTTLGVNYQPLTCLI